MVKIKTLKKSSLKKLTIKKQFIKHNLFCDLKLQAVNGMRTRKKTNKVASEQLSCTQRQIQAYKYTITHTHMHTHTHTHDDWQKMSNIVAE